MTPQKHNKGQDAGHIVAGEATTQDSLRQTSSSRTLLLLSFACAVAISNVYYCQPLLIEMAGGLHIAPSFAGLVVVCTQIGYALGILVFAPMGDSLERKRLMVSLFLGAAVAALFISYVHTAVALFIGAAGLGATAAVTHVATPVAPDIATPNRRGQAVGTVMTGILLGILLARTFAGVLSRWVGWRGVYRAAFLVDLICALLLFLCLPVLRPNRPIPYAQALGSLRMLLWQSPVLQEAILVGGASMAAFSALWTTLVFLLGSSHYSFGAAIAGAFGLLGIAGVIVAPIVGRAIDRVGTSPVLHAALAVQALGFSILWLFGYHLLGLIFGILCFDAGMQATQIANQTRIFGIDPNARGRLNTIYMTAYFGFGAIGSALGSVAWGHAAWHGVTGLGIALIAVAGFCHVLLAGRDGVQQPLRPADVA